MMDGRQEIRINMENINLAILVCTTYIKEHAYNNRSNNRPNSRQFMTILISRRLTKIKISILYLRQTFRARTT